MREQMERLGRHIAQTTNPERKASLLARYEALVNKLGTDPLAN